MHPAAKFQFERTAREFSQWRAVPEEDRSPAPAWWWQPAIDVVAQHEEMGALLCYRLQLPVGSTYAAGAAVLMATLADQTSLPWPDEFPRKTRRDGEGQAPRCEKRCGAVSILRQCAMRAGACIGRRQGICLVRAELG